MALRRSHFKILAVFLLQEWQELRSGCDGLTVLSSRCAHPEIYVPLFSSFLSIDHWLQTRVGHTVLDCVRGAVFTWPHFPP